MEWTRFEDLAQSTGWILLLVILLWSLMGGIIYWAFIRGATSMKEDVKYRFVEDDKPVSR